MLNLLRDFGAFRLTKTRFSFRKEHFEYLKSFFVLKHYIYQRLKKHRIF